MKKLIIPLLICIYCTQPILVYAQPPIQRVINEATKDSSLTENLRVLTDEIGGRVPGTPSLKLAVDWAETAFRQAGADSVAIEPYTIQMGWKEGSTTADVVSPFQFKVHIQSFGWSPALVTTSPTRIVDIGDGTEKDFKNAGDLSGAILLFHSNPMKNFDDLYNEYLNLPSVINQAEQGKAIAIAVMSTHPQHLMNRQMHASTDEQDVLPIFQIAREDAQRLSRLLKSRKNIKMMVNMPNEFTPPFTAWNVVAEIKGSDPSPEWTLLGAHLDSWDLGTGALDNGCNAALVIDALRAIKASGVTPKRTIRFALFTGEEQGFLGSHAYVLKHHLEMNKSAGVVIFDFGSGAVTGYNLNGRRDIEKNIAQLTAPVKSLGVKKFTNDASVLTDNLSFLLEGLPNILADQKMSHYLEHYHAESDTLDKVDMPQLRINTVIAAATIFAIANAPSKMHRLDLVETEKLLQQTDLVNQMALMESLELWNEIKTLREKDQKPLLGK